MVNIAVCMVIIVNLGIVYSVFSFLSTIMTWLLYEVTGIFSDATFLLSCIISLSDILMEQVKGAPKDCTWSAISQDQRTYHMASGSSRYALLIVTQQEQCVSVGKALNTQTVLLLRHVGLK